MSVPAALGVSTLPGTSCACGTRLGRPDAVEPPEVGCAAAAAARHPKSAAVRQLAGVPPSSYPPGACVIGGAEWGADGAGGAGGALATDRTVTGGALAGVG